MNHRCKRRIGLSAGLMSVLLAAGTAAASGDEPARSQGQGSKDGPLSPLAFLAGACWRGTFPDGESTDTHCYRWVYGGAFLRDTHTVRGKRPDYRGETLYHFDPEAGRIVYRYWNSEGGVSDGVVVPADGRLIVPGERHVTESGEVIELQTVIEPDGGDRYVSMTERKTPDGWEELWRIEFSRIAAATEEGPAARQQAERLAALAPLVGDWADPAKAAESREAGEPVPVQFAYRWGPHRMLLRVYEGLGVVQRGDQPAPVLEGIVFWDHLSGNYAFAASTRYGWTFDGHYEVLPDGSIQRIYDVHYAENEEYIPEPEMPGQVRRYREIYFPDGKDRLEIQLDIFKDGAWTPFGPGRYEAIRVPD